MYHSNETKTDLVGANILKDVIMFSNEIKNWEDLRKTDLEVGIKRICLAGTSFLAVREKLKIVD